MRKYRQRIHYTEADRAMMWDRWQKGDSLGKIGQLLLIVVVSSAPYTCLSSAWGVNETREGGRARRLRIGRADVQIRTTSLPKCSPLLMSFMAIAASSNG